MHAPAAVEPFLVHQALQLVSPPGLYVIAAGGPVSHLQALGLAGIWYIFRTGPVRKNGGLFSNQCPQQLRVVVFCAGTSWMLLSDSLHGCRRNRHWSVYTQRCDSLSFCLYLKLPVALVRSSAKRKKTEFLTVSS